MKIDLNGILLDEHPYYFNIGGWQNHGLVTVGDVGEKLFDPVPTSRKYAPESFKSQIIYLGVSGNDIKASYREYKDDIARPAFYQDLSYNLSDGQYIRYKKFRIKVLDATNEQIKYIVLED